MTPATQAATYSPMLCPSMPAGVTPQDSHSCASAYSTANRAGWVVRVWSISAAAAASEGSAKITSRRSRPISGFRSSAQRSIVSRNDGSAASFQLITP